MFFDKVLCNEFIARTNLRNYDVCFTKIPKKLITLTTDCLPQPLIDDFLTNDYVCSRDPNTVKIVYLDKTHALIYLDL